MTPEQMGIGLLVASLGLAVYGLVWAVRNAGKPRSIWWLEQQPDEVTDPADIAQLAGMYDDAGFGVDDVLRGAL